MSRLITQKLRHIYKIVHFRYYFNKIIKKLFWKNFKKNNMPLLKIISHQKLKRALDKIPYWEDKIEYYKKYNYDKNSGNWILPGNQNSVAKPLFKADCVNYGCGGTFMQGWLNVDLFPSADPNYKMINLLEKHPFEDDSISYGYSEDVLEHLTQAQSIFLIAEIFRTLKPSGVMRFSFPGLEGVLKRHYFPASELRIREGEFEAYSFWDHVHFYSKEEISLVAKHIGFSKITFLKFGQSCHKTLRNLETRINQSDLNTFVELEK